MTLILPQELLDLIVAHAGDKDALKACSLVCHAFLDSSRTHLFHTITFSDRRYLPTVIAFWTTSAHLYAYIQVVRLSLEWSQPAALPQFEALLKPFIHFPIQIHFHSSAGSGLPGFGSITEYFADAGTRSKLSNAITYVRSEDWSLRSPLAFTAFPNLKALSIRGPSWPIADDTGLYSFARYPPENFRLDELELGCQITPMTLSWLEQSILHSQLRTLKLNNGCSGGSVRSGYTRFNNLLRCVARTLYTFSFEPSPEEFQINTYPPYFPEFPQLQKLIFYCRHPTPSESGPFFLWVLTVLSNLPSTNSLREIIIDFPQFRAVFPQRPTSHLHIPQEFQDIMDSFQSKHDQEEKGAKDSVAALDPLLTKFDNLKTFGVVSRAPEFFRERLPGLRDMDRLIIYPPSASFNEVA